VNTIGAFTRYGGPAVADLGPTILGGMICQVTVPEYSAIWVERHAAMARTGGFWSMQI
jgi:hypothetical protein